MDRKSPSRKKTRIRAAVARYREARKTLHTPASPQSRHGLDWMNFFLADVQTGFGAFVAFYLARLGWTERSVGVALTVGGLAGVLSQIPGGALADTVSWKRSLVASGIVAISIASLILALTPGYYAVMFANLLQGSTSGLITPTIGAISLGLVGRRGMPVRTGRNYRFAAGGHALTAALMGGVGAYFAPSAIFLAAAALCIPALIALAAIRPEEIDYARARNAAKGKDVKVGRVLDLLKNHPLILFTAALVLFQLADASMLPLIGENLATNTATASSVWIAGLIIIPQIVVAIFAPWVGYHSAKRGRKPILFVGFAAEPLRAAILAFTSGYSSLILAQLLNGVSGAVIGVLTTIVITDLTAGTGRFNLAQGAVGAAIGIAASLSTLATGFLFQGVGPVTGFVVIAAIAVAATVLIWVFVSETKPPDED
ncbi:MAG TPA: MFS transporter [Xanthobacteraceae bacterium]|jgi:MFS family permease|nr:MFS transporter [Xanthobacteraceae bacterium]